MLQRSLEQQPVPVAAPAEELPENYASLPQNTKLDEEPNPFEKSFSDLPVSATKAATAAQQQAAKPVLPPVTAIESPSTGVPTLKKATNIDPYAWGSLRAGPLSPSMLQGPVNGNPVPFTATASAMSKVEPDEFVPYQPQIPTSMQYNFQANTMNAPGSKFGGKLVFLVFTNGSDHQFLKLTNRISQYTNNHQHHQQYQKPHPLCSK